MSLWFDVFFLGFFKFKDNAVAAVYNKDIKSGLSISFDSKNLPFLTSWKMMGERDYVLGLEPGNAYPGPRSEKRKDGTLVMLKPNEKLHYKFSVDLFDKERKFNNLKGE